MATWTMSLLVVGALAGPSLAIAAESSPSPCTDGTHPEYRQADFWIGHWDVVRSSSNTSHVATVTISKSVNGCALSEIWAGKTGDAHGLIAYSPSTRKWDYLYVEPTGDPIRLDDGVLAGSDFKFNQAVPVDGKVHHWTLSLLRDGTLRELSVGSSDGGKTWTTDYDLKWIRKK
jgi:hypothetical protein